MADNWYAGNAVADGQGDNRGWLIGHFLDGSAGVRSSDAVEVKWGIHPAGDNREADNRPPTRQGPLPYRTLDWELRARAGRGLCRLGAGHQPLVVCGSGLSRDYGPVALPAAVRKVSVPAWSQLRQELLPGHWTAGLDDAHRPGTGHDLL
jgi:hypothetical protein